MSKIVIINEEKIDNRTTLEEIVACQSIKDVANNEEVVYTISSASPSVNELVEKGHDVYIPFEQLKLDGTEKDRVFVYFDLENYPFYQSAKAIMNDSEDVGKKKGVFRYRRTVNDVKDTTLISDLFVIYALFGEPVSVHVKQTDQSIQPAHTILMVNFGNGILAHIEYTKMAAERIEWEWSGIRHIIEFDSHQMRPFEPVNETKLPLLYSVDSILQTAKLFDEEMETQIRSIQSHLDGGTDK